MYKALIVSILPKKKAVNMFERMEIVESIFEGVVETSYKKPIRADANHACYIRQKRGNSPRHGFGRER